MTYKMVRFSGNLEIEYLYKAIDFYLLLKNGESIAKIINKNVSGKYSQKLLHLANKSTTDVPKTSSKRVIQKTAEATGDLIGNKIANKITRI